MTQNGMLLAQDGTWKEGFDLGTAAICCAQSIVRIEKDIPLLFGADTEEAQWERGRAKSLDKAKEVTKVLQRYKGPRTMWLVKEMENGLFGLPAFVIYSVYYPL